MKKISLFVMVLFLIAPLAIAQEPEPWVDMEYGRYRIEKNVMQWDMNVPVMTDRFSSVGALIDGVPDMKNANKAVPKALELRDKILALRFESGIFKFNQVVFYRQNFINVVRKRDTHWDILKDEIIPIFDEVYAQE